MITTLTPTAQQWDSFVVAHPRAHILQLSAWAGQKRPYGWESARIALADGDQIVGGAQILFRRLPFRLGTMAYLPMGPLLTERGQRESLWRAIDDVCRQRRAAFLKWEPGILEEGDPPHDFARYGFRQSGQTIQPPRTILIDIGDDGETILSRMNQGTRRKIRQSQKHNIRYYEASRADAAKFTRMIQTTGSRNEFGVHESGYYTLAYDLFVPQHAALILAEHTDPATDDLPERTDDLAGVFVFAIGTRAWYFYGASSSIKRNLMASYGVQWEAIQWAKRRGCTVYDLWGIPDEGEDVLEAQFEQRDDGLWGVYGFKRGWGGKIVRTLGAWDKVYNPLVYMAFQVALRVRNRAAQVDG
jgi:lipid II:glycine glycyltransferase (peptidoglycan interpeptide bridge formation enzyme)